MTESLAVALGWLAAVTSRDKARLLALSADDITLHGPRGAAKGHAVLGEWFEGAAFRASPKEAYARDHRILVLHGSQWLDAEGDVTGTAESASVFAIERGKVAGYHRDDRPDPLRHQGFRGAQKLELPVTTR